MFSLEYFQILITILTFLGLFTAFILEKIPAHICSMAAMAVLLLFQVIDTDEALSVFSNSAPITIAAMFIISGALMRTGWIDVIGNSILEFANISRFWALTSLFVGALIASAFINNTPVIIVMTPIVINIARSLKVFPSKFLIPLSYCSIFGGTCTLIGTSTNLLVDGEIQAMGLPAIGIFDVTVPGLIIAFAGMVFMYFIGKYLLPDRNILEDEVQIGKKRKKFFAEALIPIDSDLIGKSLREIQFTESEDYEILDLIRYDIGAYTSVDRFLKKVGGGEQKNISSIWDIPLQAGDRLIFKTIKNQLIEIKQTIGVTFNKEDEEEISHSSEHINTREVVVKEGIIRANSYLIGKQLSTIRLRRKYGCYVIAINREKQNIKGNLESIYLKQGDVLLLEGPEDELVRLFEHHNLAAVTQRTAKLCEAKHRYTTLATVLAFVLAASLRVMPLAGLSIIAAMILILFGCIPSQKIGDWVEWKILMLIYGMLGVSLALENTGIAKFIVQLIVQNISGWGVFPIILALYLLTSIMTELITNNAAAVILAPISIAIANSLNLSPTPFVMTVIFGASASFATPFSYQVNTYIYNAGNYVFKDFLRVGIPLKAFLAIVTTATIYLLYI